MNHPSAKRPGSRLRDALGIEGVVLLAWFALYLSFFAKPRLVYHAQGPSLLLEREFLIPFLRYPGGPVTALSRFLAQLFAWSWAGVAILTAEAALIAVLGGACLRAIAGRPAGVLRLVPVALFMLLAGQWSQPLAAGPALIAILLCAAAFAGLPLRARPLRFAVYLLLAGALYYLVGAVSPERNRLLTLGAFAFLCGLSEIRRARGPLVGWAWLPAYPAAAAALAAAGERSIFAVAALVQRPGDMPQPACARLYLWLYLSYPLAGLWLAADPLQAAARLWARLQAARPGNESAGPGAAPARPDRPVRRWAGIAAAVALLSWVALGPLDDGPARRLWHIDDCMASRRWEDALAALRVLPASERNVLTQHDVNRALFETGRLADEMFAWEQSGLLVLPYHEPAPVPYVFRDADLCLRMGRVNDAEHMACEAFLCGDYAPEIVRILALVEMTKGRMEAAGIFLRTLERDVVHRAWARRYLRLMERDPHVDSDPEVAQLRRVMLREDDVFDVTAWVDPSEDRSVMVPDRMFLNSSRGAKSNRMAFEYFMAFCLLDGGMDRLQQLAGELHRLPDFGLSRLPRSYAEGLAIYEAEGGKAPEPGVPAAPREDVERYRRLRDDLAAGRLNLETAQARPEYRGSYYLYWLARRGGG